MDGKLDLIFATILGIALLGMTIWFFGCASAPCIDRYETFVKGRDHVVFVGGRVYWRTEGRCRAPRP